MKTITVTIDKTGKPKIEAHGFMDGACKAATKPLEDALSNGDKEVVVEKPEMFIAESNSANSGLLA